MLRRTWWVVGLVLVAMAATAHADDRFYNGIDRDRLWNPFLGTAPWLGEALPVAVRTEVSAAPIVGTTVLGAPLQPPIARSKGVGACNSLVHHTIGADIDRDQLWNPLLGCAPWHHPIPGSRGF